MGNLYSANSQWSSRPADERFWSLEEAYAATKAHADTAAEFDVDFGVERLVTEPSSRRERLKAVAS